MSEALGETGLQHWGCNQITHNKLWTHNHYSLTTNINHHHYLYNNQLRDQIHWYFIQASLFLCIYYCIVFISLHSSPRSPVCKIGSTADFVVNFMLKDSNNCVSFYCTSKTHLLDSLHLSLTSTCRGLPVISQIVPPE